MIEKIIAGIIGIGKFGIEIIIFIGILLLIQLIVYQLTGFSIYKKLNKIFFEKYL